MHTALGSTHTDTAWEMGAGEALAPTLLVVHHPDPRFIGARRPLRPGERLVLGRGGATLGFGVLNNKRISRRHAAIRCQDGLLHVEDLGSQNGTWCNGTQIERERLRSGDVLAIGDLLLVVRWAPARWTLPDAGPLIGWSPALGALLDTLNLIAPLDSAVLIRGETGTGKELVAAELHRRSGRGGPLLALNCGGMDSGLLYSELFGHARGAFTGADRAHPGLIQAADKGTLFLDEIGESSPHMQTSLLRVLQEREVRPLGSSRAHRVQTRFVAATHRDLEHEVATGGFREDLYARLSRWVIEVPPLRARREDILPIALSFAQALLGHPVSLHRRLASCLLLHDWPRNVRELQTIVERVAIPQRGERVLDVSDAVAGLTKPPAGRGRPSPHILRARIQAQGGNIKGCASELGVSRNTLYRWIREADIDLIALRQTG